MGRLSSSTASDADASPSEVRRHWTDTPDDWHGKKASIIRKMVVTLKGDPYRSFIIIGTRAELVIIRKRAIPT
jgi:hypothetical protein